MCQWVGTEQARVLVYMRVCQTSVLQESACVQAHAHTHGEFCECLKMRLFEDAQRKGCCTRVGMHVTRGVNMCVKEWECKPVCSNVADVQIVSTSKYLP